MPRWFYKASASMMWYWLSWKNKVRFKDIRRKPEPGQKD
jgi:hypothetical protein